MQSDLASKFCAVLGAGLAFVVEPPLARAESDTAPTVSESAAEAERQRRAAELVKELMEGESEEEDLAWLYSNADEYAPSDLTGKPLPAPALPSRGEGAPRAWDPSWQKAGLAHQALVVGGFALGLASFLVPPRSNAWRTRNAFDEWGLSNVGAESYEAGLWARDASDALVSLNLSYPLLVDALIVTYWYRRSPEVAEQMAWITLEAAAVATALQGTTAGLTRRERPFGTDCGGDLPRQFADCESRDRYRSFFSGHATMAFSTAAVTCSHHARHDVFDSPLADGIACGAALASAAVVGTMRVVGRKHYPSDVLTGAAVGTLSGLGVPWLLHYGPLARRSSASGLNVALIPLPGGIAAGGRF